MFITTIGPSDWDYNETLSTLGFASRCMNIAAAPVQNRVDSEEDQSELVAALKVGCGSVVRVCIRYAPFSKTVLFFQVKLNATLAENDAFKTEIQEWKSQAVSWKQKHDEKSVQLQRNAIVLKQATARVETLTAQSSTEKPQEIGRPLRRVMSQMYEFYGNILQQLRFVITIALGGNTGTRDHTSKLLSHAWHQCYDETRDVTHSSRSDLLDEGDKSGLHRARATELLLKHREYFPIVSDDGHSWVWSPTSWNAVGFHELSKRPVELERVVAQQEQLLRKHCSLLADILKFRSAVAAGRENSTSKIAPQDHSIGPERHGVKGRDNGRGEPITKNTDASPDSDKIIGFLMQQNAELKSRLLDSTSKPGKGDTVSPIDSVGQRNREGNVAIVTTPRPSRREQNDGKVTSSSNNSWVTPGMSTIASAAKSHEFVSPVERPEPPRPTLQPSRPNLVTLEDVLATSIAEPVSSHGNSSQPQKMTLTLNDSDANSEVSPQPQEHSALGEVSTSTTPARPQPQHAASPASPPSPKDIILSLQQQVLWQQNATNTWRILN